MTEQVTKIIRRAKDVWRFGDTHWLLWIISDHEAYWIHTNTDTVIGSARNYGR